VLAGRFRLEDLLDENDGARFWRATDRTLARSVAVHVLPDTDPRASALLRAARSSALVSDPRLLRVLDAASADGVVYVVNEWGSGVSLDRMLVDGPLSPRRAAWVVREVAEAITTAHRNGVAHGRLLPENVMVSESGAVKVVGFVIDAVLRDNPEASTGSGRRRVTGGDPVGALESDVLNLAGLLYAALVGRWPGTEGSTIPAAPAEHGRPLRPRQVRAGVPRPLDSICDRVLNRDGSTAHLQPIGTAHEVFVALSDYIGVPSGSTAVAAHTRPVLGVRPSGPAEAGTGSSADPEATQAAPMFLDLDEDVTRLPSAHGGGPRTEGPPADVPERPLFGEGPHASTTADPPRRRSLTAGDTGSFTGAQRSTGAGNGRLPASWGPDPDTSPPGAASGAGDEGVPGRTWLSLAVVLGVVLVLVVGVVLATDLGRGPGEDRTTGQQPSTSRSGTPRTSARIAIAGVRDFDPQGDPAEENPELAGLAIDGNPATAWRTSTYYDPISELKSGVGLLVDFGGRKRVGEVRLTLLGNGTSLDVLAAPGEDSAPTSNEDLQKVASVAGAGTDVDLRLKKDVTTRWLAVWLTALPRVPGGYQGRVAEISVRS